MQKKAVASLLAKNNNQAARLFMVVPKASFHASKAANVEVSIEIYEKSKRIQTCGVINIDDRERRS